MALGVGGGEAVPVGVGEAEAVGDGVCVVE